jgi:hypothetical protein
MALARKQMKLLLTLLFVLLPPCVWCVESDRSRCLSLADTDDSTFTNDDISYKQSTQAEVLNSCQGEIQLLGNRVNLGIHRVGSLGTMASLTNESYYNNQLSAVSSIYAPALDDIFVNYVVDDYNGTAAAIDDVVLDSTLPPFVGDFFYPGFPLEGGICSICTFKYILL